MQLPAGPVKSSTLHKRTMNTLTVALPMPQPHGKSSTAFCDLAVGNLCSYLSLLVALSRWCNAVWELSPERNPKTNGTSQESKEHDSKPTANLCSLKSTIKDATSKSGPITHIRRFRWPGKARNLKQRRRSDSKKASREASRAGTCAEYAF